MEQKINIRHLSLDELKTNLVQHQFPAFKAKQVYEWLWKKSCTDFTSMNNIGKDLQQYLITNFKINAVNIHSSQHSNDGTIKNAFQLADGNIVEGVLIPTTSRVTACISSQVGCSLTCKFCATGKLDRKRNIDYDEIYDQVVAIKKQADLNYNRSLTNIVYMGMGEPLLNYANTLKSIEKITSPEGLGMSPNRITVSTAGVAKMIIKLADDNVKFNLAISLHAANDEKRNHIMPINESNSLSALADALKYFYEKTQIRPTYEYIVFKDFNDGLIDAEELYQFSKHVPCKINIIEYNPIDGGEFQQTLPIRLEKFKNYLEKKNVIINVRRSRGKDIDAACGQLANKNKAVTTV